MQARLLAAAMVWASAVQAEPTLMGRLVGFQVQAWNDPAQPIFDGRVHNAVVGPDVEYGLTREGAQNGVDVVPVLIDISSNRIVMDYANSPPGLFLAAEFNGYILDFATECVLFREARIDRANTTLPLEEGDVFFERGRLFIDVGGHEVTVTDRVSVDFKVEDCPLS